MNGRDVAYWHNRDLTRSRQDVGSRWNIGSAVDAIDDRV